MSDTPVLEHEGAVDDQFSVIQRLYEESLKTLDEGQLLKGLIVAKSNDELLVDIGGNQRASSPPVNFHPVSRSPISRSATRSKSSSIASIAKATERSISQRSAHARLRPGRKCSKRISVTRPSMQP